MKKPKRKEEHNIIKIDDVVDQQETKEPTLPLIHMYI
jgi:hypothetical protein